MKSSWKRILIDGLILAAVALAAIGIAWLMEKKVNAAEITYAAIEYQYFHKSARFAEMPNHTAKEGLGVRFNVKLVGPLYWNNRIHALTDSGQYRLVGWNFEVGLHPLFWIDDPYARGLQFFYNHHSQHLLEDKHPEMKFPVNDSLGLRWVIYIAPEQGFGP